MSMSLIIIEVCFLICLSLCFSLSSSYLLNNETHFLIRNSRQTACRQFQFKCGSGECIAEEFQCDGKENCKDGSDETEDCASIPCHSYLFKCNYGACINGEYECDGKKDCRDNSDENTPRCKKSVSPVHKPDSTTGCRIGEFRCNSGQCINDTFLCDGVANCKDASDETAKECSGFPCPLFTFKCDYGACVNGNAKCNGKRECHDGSDEKSSLCGSSPRPPPVPTPTPPHIPDKIPPDTDTTGAIPGSCKVPPHPKNGFVAVQTNEPSEKYPPGSYVNPFTLLAITCNRGYRLRDNINISACLNGQWNFESPPECLRHCRTVESSVSTNVECTLYGQNVSCVHPLEDTIAFLSCNRLYEQPGLSNNPSTRCKDGTWDFNLPKCLPICGLKHPRGSINVIGGSKATKGDYPWQVGIYSKLNHTQHICGGSIINQKVVLSAAHCFANNDDGSQNPAENYLVAAGKYYRDYRDPRDESAQYSEISSLHFPERYKGELSNYEADIAVVVLTTAFKLSLEVLPVCVDYLQTFENQQLSEGNTGLVTGWGFTAEGIEPSPVLKELEVPYVSYQKCFSSVPDVFKPYLTIDKLCAGFLANGTSVCQGDSGGGLVFRKPENDRYYIRGVVSTSPARHGNCDSNQYGTYTKISFHSRFINNYATMYRPVD